MTPAAVEVANVTHRFGARTAVNDVSFVAPQAEILAVLGPNGCGKTTLFRILTTALTPHAGRVRILGLEMPAQRTQALARIGVVFQRPAVDGKLTVLENLLHHGMLYGMSGSALLGRARECLDDFEIASRANDRAEVLSGGLIRRVELAKCILHRPEVLILDEPSTGLDPGARMALSASLRRLRDEHGVASLLTTHWMDEADGGDRVLVMNQGRLVANDAPDQLKSRIGGDVVTLRCSAPEALAAGIQSKFSVPSSVIDGEVRLEVARAHEFLPRLIESFPGVIHSASLGKPTLEDVFVSLTGRRLSPEPDGAGEPAAHPVRSAGRWRKSAGRGRLQP